MNRIVRKHRKSDAKNGFTLIEIMVVMIIVGMLAAVVTPIVFDRLEGAQIAKAKLDLKTLESALEVYRLDNFAYPSSTFGLDALVSRPTDPTVTNWKAGGYIKRLPKDPWGNDYQYLYPGQNGEVDIYTYGKDKRPGGEEMNADVGIWSLE